ncbi:MAG: DUF3291 domain-containing protein [Xanthobacteraceae bacterium]|jgi:Domain of unknown function (DUF3291)
MSKVRHLAQLNIGRFRYPTDDPRMADFMNNLALVNGLADRSAGFVWRLQDDSGNATAFRPFPDPQMAVNLSVWESVEALERFVYLTLHKRFYGRRDEWFEKLDSPHSVMWWVPEGHRPSVIEAKQRLESLAAHGPSEHAFDWQSVPSAQMWKTASCSAPGGQAA